MARPTTVSIVKCALLLGFTGLFGATLANRFMPSSHAQNGGGPPAAPAPTQTAPASTEKTAEQQFKNITVLKDMPASQLGPVMNFMAASLGVNCAFCHAEGEGGIDFAKDDKREKGTARKMIQMVMDLNNDNFNGRVSISCFTCHQGHEHTNGMIPLPVSPHENPPEESGPGAGGPGAGGPGRPGGAPGGPGGPGGAGRPGGPGAGAPNPAVEAIFDKFAQAIGGRAALDQAKSRVGKGAQTGGDGKSINIEVSQTAPNKLADALTMPQGVVMRVYDGAKGFMKGPRGAQEFGAMQINDLVHTDLGWAFNLKGRYTNSRQLGTEKIGDREVAVVMGMVSDSVRERLYFDTQTGLLLRVLVTERSLVGWIPTQIDYDDYRDVGGIKVPFSIKHSPIDARNNWTRKFTEIKLNVPVDDKIFVMPPPPPSPAAAPAKP